MKAIRVIIVVLLVSIVVLSVGVVIFLKTVDLNRFKAQIVSSISKSIGRDVAMRHVSFKFFFGRGVILDISGLSVKDHPDFSSESILYVDSAHLDVDILPFVLKRQVLVSKVELNSLKVNLIRSGNGEINFQRFSQQIQAKPSKGMESTSASKQKTDDPQPRKPGKDFDFSEMLIRSILITDGVFIFTDRSVEPAITISVEDFELNVSNLSLNAPFPFEVTATLWSERPNIRINGLAQINTQNKQVRIDDLKVQTDLSKLVLRRVFDGIPMLKASGIEDGIKGHVTIDIHQMILGEGGVLVLSSEARLTDGALPLKESPVALEDISMHLEATEMDVELREMIIPLASGKVKISGRILGYPAEQKLLMNLDVSDVDVAQLAKRMGMPVALLGNLSGLFKAKAKGLSSKAFKSSLSGEGNIEVRDGRVLDVNILKLVLSKISFIPNLTERIEQGLPDRYKEKLKSKDTILEKVSADLQVRDQALFINTAEVNADGFLVVANGKLNFDQTLNLKADLYIPDDLSASMVSASSELSYLLNERKQIQIPFRPYTGKLANFVMYPDVEDLGREILLNRGKEELRKVLRKALDLDGETPTDDGQIPKEPGAEPSQTEQPSVQERERSPEEMIIESIMDIIPIFQ